MAQAVCIARCDHGPRAWQAAGHCLQWSSCSCRLWFVRVPRPPEVVAAKALEQELETYRAQYKLLSESFTVKKVRVREGATQVPTLAPGLPACPLAVTGA